MLEEPPERTPLVDLVARARDALTPAGAVRAVAATGALLVVITVGWWLLRPPPTPVEAALPRASVPTTVTSTTATSVVVQAAGAVARPGVYRLPAGARVADLLEMAGVLPEAEPQALALAALLVDGQRVWVPKVGEEPALGTVPGAVAAAGAAPLPVDLNTADAALLDTLPGVGPALAAAILQYRDQMGRFTTVDDLLDVPGIGPATLERVRPLVRV